MPTEESITSTNSEEKTKESNKKDGTPSVSNLILLIPAPQMHFSNKIKKKKVVKAFFLKISRKPFLD